MTQSHDDHQQHVILHGVDDPVVAYPHTEARTPLQGACARWSRILGEERDGALHASPSWGIELAQSASRGRT